MKTFHYLALLIAIGLFVACSGNTEEPAKKSYLGQKSTPETKVETTNTEVVPASKRITLENKGVGKVKSLKLEATIDNAKVQRGAALFKTNCTACHKTTKRFIGPNPTGILERRSPEWVMNMILDPGLMTEEDQCAKDLLVEFNGAAMANQNMTEDQARDILEYFRTLK